MIIYLHGFDSNSPGNHEKVLQLQFIDPDVRLISYSTRHPKHDMQHLLKEVDKMLLLFHLLVAIFEFLLLRFGNMFHSQLDILYFLYHLKIFLYFFICYRETGL